MVTFIDPDTGQPITDPALREAATDRLVPDYCDILHHVLSHPEWYLRTKAIDALLAATERRELPERDILSRVVGYVCFQMQFNESRQPLTDAERTTKAAAWRLSDMLHGPRSH